MRTVLQRVLRAEVRIRGDEDITHDKELRHDRIAGRIGPGLLVLVGFSQTDTDMQLQWMADKVVDLRLFADGDGRMNLSVQECGGALLVVSQFTLYGDARKGRRPSFITAAPPDIAEPLYESFLILLRSRNINVEAGEFGADMEVELVNDGPVTLVLEREADTGRTQA